MERENDGSYKPIMMDESIESKSFECLPFRMDDASNADELFASHYIPSYTQLMMLFDSTHKEGKAHDGCTKQRDDGLPNDCLSSLDDPCAGRMCVSISRRRDTTEKERQCMCSTGENSRTVTKSECKRSLLPLEIHMAYKMIRQRAYARINSFVIIQRPI
ncbi:hypothetical protein OUZ56_008254 [Daphnia magna]|uniref:Uncharacterized protein n=1 Tax=Daphnia magna TaxID=35525 RepID=A0ABR0ACF1_9CRUS|nr:hypothetical protein OUZ56_008254 [Daphnia magna]